MAYRALMRHDQIALQLYTVRELMAKDLAGTLRAVAAAGYRAVELAGLPETAPGALPGLLREAGLRVVASHEGIERLREDVAAVADRLAEVDCRRVIVPWMPEEDRRTADDVRRFASELGGFARDLAARGVRLGYHNHDFEFAPLDGSTVWDILLAELSPEDRALIHWHYYEGQSLAEIGIVLGVSREALKMRLSRVREKLRQLWGTADG